MAYVGEKRGVLGEMRLLSGKSEKNAGGKNIFKARVGVKAPTKGVPWTKQEPGKRNYPDRWAFPFTLDLILRFFIIRLLLLSGIVLGSLALLSPARGRSLGQGARAYHDRLAPLLSLDVWSACSHPTSSGLCTTGCPISCSPSLDPLVNTSTLASKHALL